MPNYATKTTIAHLHGVHPRTIANWHNHGFITAYRLPGRSKLLFDVDEVARAVATNDSMRTPAKITGGVVVINDPNVKIVPELAVKR